MSFRDSVFQSYDHTSLRFSRNTYETPSGWYRQRPILAQHGKMKHWMGIILIMVWRKMVILISRNDIIYMFQLRSCKGSTKKSCLVTQLKSTTVSRLTVENSDDDIRLPSFSIKIGDSAMQCYFSRSAYRVKV